MSWGSKAIFRICVVAGLLVAAACSPPSAAQETDASPAAQEGLTLTGWVTDAAALLSPEQEARLAKKLSDLQSRTGHQFVVVTTPSLDGEPIEAYSLRMAKKWGIGRKEHDDGVVLLVAPNERRVRIEVGFGLEATLTNPICEEILSREVLTRFSAGDLPGGIEAGVASMVERLE